MADAQVGFTKAGFAKTFVLPALFVFLVPTLALLFFLHAQSVYDAQMLEGALQGIREDATLSADERQRAEAFVNEHPFSELIQDPKIAAGFERRVRFDYFTFRWMIRLGFWSIVAGVAMFALGGVCVLLSRRSQRAQYLSLSIGFQVLRVYSAVQTVIQGTMLVALSFWVTALWFNIFIPKIIFLVGLLAICGVGAVVWAIFKRPPTDSPLEGTVIDRAAAPRLWDELQCVCARVGTDPPDQVVAGIDTNFFVTQTPVQVGGTTYTGRTLYVSLALLKQMSGAEADAVLAHEMAHFSGHDTLYSKRTSPLLVRWGMYLQALHENPITRPTYYFMNCFRALFELSLREHSRQREFRADRIAAETTSPADFAGALLRIAAYADFREKVQLELYKNERPLESANISGQIDEGFHAHALSYVARPDLGSTETTHPFDSHPPLSQRFAAVGVALDSEEVQELVAEAGDGRWYGLIDGAEDIEGRQWRAFEEGFRSFHEQTLAHRFLPQTDEELAIVVHAFPEITIEGKKGSLVLDHATIRYTAWPGAIAYSEIGNCSVVDNVLYIPYVREGKQKAKIPLKTFGKRSHEALEAFNRYYSRYLNAVAYQEQKRAEGEGGSAA